MKAESSEVEEILQLGSFEKGLRAELRACVRSERNMLLAFAGAFFLGIVTGFWISEKMER